MHLDGWTLLLQAINLVVLLALLRWLFYRPLLAVIDARRAAVDAEFAKVTAASHDVEEKAKALADERAGLAASRDALLQAARTEAERTRDAAQDVARRAAETALAEGRQQLDRERQEASRALQDEASTLAASLARRLLTLVPRPDGDADFVAALIARLRAVGPGERATWFAAGTPRAVVLASAHPLEASQRDGALEALRDIFGADAQVEFEVDDALIAGAELRMPHGVFALHWAAELARARRQMQPAPGSKQT